MRALLITGPIGVGKTTVAEAVGDVLAAASVPHAVIDLDGLRRSWPSPADDPFNLGLELRNLKAVPRNHRDAGAERLVLAGVVESRLDRSRYAEVLGVDLLVCRLIADLAVIRERLVARHRADSGLAWHVNRAGELAEIFTSAGIEDFTIAADRPPSDVAEAVLLRWRAEIDSMASE